MFGFRVSVHQLELPYTTVAAFYIGEQLLFLAIHGFTGAHRIGGLDVVAEVAKLSGAVGGAAIGWAMLKANLVDCEGWDVLSLWKQRKRLAKDWTLREQRLDRQKKNDARRARRAEADAEVPTDEERAAKAVAKVRRLIESEDFDGAVSAFDKSARVLPNWPSESDALALIKECHARKAEAASIPLMRDFCRKYPDSSAAPRMKLKLAQVLLRDRQKPTAALRTLREISAGSLPANLDAIRGKLEDQARRMVEDGVLELEGED